MGSRRTIVLIAFAFVLVFAAFSLASRLIVEAFNGPPSNCTPPNCSSAIGVNGQNNLSVGTSTPLGNTKFLIVASSSNDNANYSLQILYPNSSPILTVRNDGEIGIGTASPAYTLDVNGTVNATTLLGSFSGIVNANNISNGVFGANTGGGIYSFPSSLGVATTSNSSLPQSLSVFGGGYFSGNVGIGTTAPQAKLDVNGTLNVSGMHLYPPFNLPNTGGSAQWVKIGTLTAAQQGISAYINVISNNGYNANIDQNYEVHIRFKTSNGGSVDANGFCADSSYYVTGENAQFASSGGIKWVANESGCSATTYTLYMDLGAYTGNGSFYNVQTTGGTWANVGATGQTDPGAASATVQIPVNELVVQGNAYVSANSFYPLTLNSTDGAGNGPGIIWENGGTTQWYTYVGGSGTFYFSDSANNIMSIARGAPAGSLNIASTGDVGIGVSPAYTLDVNGPIKTRSASGIIFSDGTSQGTTANWSGTADYLTKSDPTFSGAVKLGLSQVYDNGTNVGIGTTSPGAKLEVNGTGIFRSTLYVNNNGTSGGSGATGAIVLGDGTISKAYGSGFTMNSSLTLNGGSGKLTAGTVDPIYTIGGSRYATYGPEAVGVNVEKFGTVTLAGSGSACNATLDFGNAAKGSGLWLFAKTTDLKDNFGKLAVELTPSFDGSVWYKENTANLTLQIFASATDPAACDSAEVSYHLTAPRFDASQWSNFVPASESANATGLIIND